jgi:hypothetical protein
MDFRPIRVIQVKAIEYESPLYVDPQAKFYNLFSLTILDILLLLICNNDGSVSIAYGSSFDILYTQYLKMAYVGQNM